MVGDKDLAYADSLCANITGLDDNSIRCACKLVAYDVAYRRGPLEYLLYDKSAQDVSVTENDIFNVRLLVSRFLEFAKTFPMVQAGTDFPGAYTGNVYAGDCDFIGSDTLWDMKCTKTGATNKMSLQLAMYYYMGKRSEYAEAYASITKIGVFNPKLNKCWVWDMTQIPSDVEATILHDVLGYAE